MDFRTRLTNWSLPVLLIGVPLCAALAHASAAGIEERPLNRPSQQVNKSSKPATPAAALPSAPQNRRPLPPR
jgi:hypothetical protein